MNRERLETAAITLAITFAVLVVGFIVFLYSGIYPIAANQSHLPFVEWTLTTLQENAVGRRADDSQVPPLDDAGLLQHGGALYEARCATCHGAPGTARDIIGIGLNPNPPRLSAEVQDWSDAELFWIIRNGLKMAGMPAFEAGHTERDLWALVAFTRRLPTLAPDEYRFLAASGAPDTAAGNPQWILAGKDSLRRAAGDPDRGQRMLEIYGCGSCHVIPGVPLARGKVGPPLTDYGERHYVAGDMLNTPMNLTAWILDPTGFEPGTAMPNVGVLPEDAWDMAAYLLTLGDATELGPPHPLPTDLLPLPHGKTVDNVTGAANPRAGNR
jgi:mono/diheme cytochrome c family protein